MRLLLAITAALLISACAGTPRQPTPEEKAAADAIDKSGINPRRAKGPYRVVLVEGEKKYCRKELATGSHVNFRTICLSEQEYLTMQEEARKTVDEIQGAGSRQPSSIPDGLYKP